ncbi:MAG TPA: EF-hand domain-containing protein, partial [Gemmataceae bacterium]|nr:EF-hand domain-containing protein [Gemmataceae bacterium]
MRTRTAILLTSGLLFVGPVVIAQPPPGGPDVPGRAPSKEEFVSRMMAFDKNKDGKLTRDEITDARLQRLFDRADANKDGVVTKEELAALYDREGRLSGGPGGAGGFGPPGGGRFDPPGRGGFGAPPRPGQVLPDFLQRRLNLTEEQKKKVADLQKEVDAGL